MTCGVGMRLNIPYLQGAYLAFNALPDAWFVGDGPSCIFDKAEHVHGRHDLFSTLLSADGAHRIQHTGVNVQNIAGDCEGMIASALRRAAAFDGCRAVFLGSMPMCAITGTDYERVLRDALAGSRVPSFLLPRRSAMAGDWLDGYAAVLEALASGVDLSGAKPEPGAVALVGHFMDRNEGDHRGNVAELERLLRELGLNPVSTWLSGRPFRALGEARRASAVISLPHGRKAARVLAGRLGVPVVEADLPFGLEASRRFVEQAGRGLGREAQARALAARELDAVIPRLQWTVPHAFLGRRFAFSGDPRYAARFVEQIEDLGGKTAGILALGGARHLPEADRELLAARGARFEPLPEDVADAWKALSADGADLIVGSAFAFDRVRRGDAFLEFGYPSEDTHFLRDEPFLGFQGALAFLSRAANEVARGLNRRTR